MWIYDGEEAVNLDYVQTLRKEDNHSIYLFLEKTFVIFLFESDEIRDIKFNWIMNKIKGQNIENEQVD